MFSACTPHQTSAGSTWTRHIWGMICPKTETVTRERCCRGRRPIGARTDTLRRLQRVLESAGIEFKPDGSVRLREAADA
jgi:hypothetical protein